MGSREQGVRLEKQSTKGEIKISKEAIKNINFALKSLVEESYDLFRDFHVNKIRDSCTFCCIDKNEENYLINTPIRNISLESLSQYNDAAFSHRDFNSSELKHFLPRYLDIIKDLKSPSHSFELSLQRVKSYANEDLWDEKEINLINKFGELFLKKCLLIYPLNGDVFSIIDVLIMLWNANIDLKKLLSLWVENKEIESIFHFKDLIFNDIKFQYRRKLKINNPFSTEEFSSIICQWLALSKTRQVFSEKIEYFLLETSSLSEEDEEELSIFHEVINAYSWRSPC